MKKILSFSVAVLLMAGLAGCIKDANQSEKEYTITFIAGKEALDDEDNKTPNGAPTKTYHNNGDIFWDQWDSEKAGLFIHTSGHYNRQLSGNATGGGRTVEFTGSIPNGTGNHTAHLLYPYTNHPVPNSELEYPFVRAIIPTTQMPVVNASYQSYDPKAHIMTTEAVDFNFGTTQSVSVNFRHAVAIVKIILKPKSGATIPSGLLSEPLESFSITTDSNLAGNVEINLQSGKIVGFCDDDSASKTIDVNFDNIKTPFLKPNGTDAIFLCVAPTILAQGSRITITAQTENYTISGTLTLPNAKTFTAGHISPIEVTFAEAQIKSDGSPLPLHETFNTLINENPNLNESVGVSDIPLVVYPFGDRSIDNVLNIAKGNEFVHNAGEKLKLSNPSIWGTINVEGEETGAWAHSLGFIQTKPLNLSTTFTVMVRASGWPKKPVSAAQTTKIRITVGDNYQDFSLKPVGGSGNFIENGYWQMVRATFSAAGNRVPVKVEGLGYGNDTGSQSDETRFFIDDLVVCSGNYLDVDKKEFSVKAVGTGSTSLLATVMSRDDNWSTTPNDAWITNIETLANGLLSFRVAENTGSSERTGTITISATGSPDVTITIKQEGKPSEGVEKELYLFTTLGTIGSSGAHLNQSHTNEISNSLWTNTTWDITWGAKATAGVTIGGSGSSSLTSMTLNPYTAINSCLVTGSQDATYLKSALVCQNTFEKITKVELWFTTAPSGAIWALVYSENGTTWKIAVAQNGGTGQYTSLSTFTVTHSPTKISPYPQVNTPQVYTFENLGVTAKFALVCIQNRTGTAAYITSPRLKFYSLQ